MTRDKLELRPMLALMLASAFAFSGCQKVQKIKTDLKSWWSSKSAEEGQNAAAPKASDEAVGEYFPVKKTTLKDALEKRGTLSATERIEIRADKKLKLGPAKVEAFAKVKKGQVLFEVDTKEVVAKQIETKERLEQTKIDVQAAKSQLDFAKKQVDRKRALAQKGITPKKELEDTEQAYEQALTGLQTKELELKKADREASEASIAVTSASVISPIDGVVSKIDQGAKDIEEGFAMATISNMASLSVYIEADEGLVSRLPPGYVVDVTLDALGQTTLKGSVKSVAKSQNGGEFGKVFEIRIDLPPEVTKGQNLKDGFEATVTAVFEERKNVLSVPKAALKQNGSDTYLLVAKSSGGKPSSRKATVGLQTELEAEIMEGVSPGDFVVAGPRG